MLVHLQGLGLGGQGQEVDLPPEGLPGGGAAAQVLPEGLAQGLGLRLQAQGLAHLLEEGKGVGLAQALEGELQALAGEVLEGLFRRFAVLLRQGGAEGLGLELAFEAGGKPPQEPEVGVVLSRVKEVVLKK